MARYSNIITKWKYDEVDNGDSGVTENKKRKSDEISAPLEHLEELKDSDYKLADHQPDIYGWNAVDATGKAVGVVHDFLFDRNEKEIRYLIVKLQGGGTAKGEKKIIIPIGKAQVNKQKRKVTVQKSNLEELLNIYVYKNVKNLAIRDEKEILSAFSSESMEDVDYKKHHFYNHEAFDEERFFGTDFDLKKEN